MVIRASPRGARTGPTSNKPYTLERVICSPPPPNLAALLARLHPLPLRPNQQQGAERQQQVPPFLRKRGYSSVGSLFFPESGWPPVDEP